jgi:hypothetical protein
MGRRQRLSKNRVLRRIFGYKGEEVAGGWERLHNEDLHNLCTSPNVVSVIKPKMVRWAGHFARLREMRNAYKLQSEHLT